MRLRPDTAADYAARYPDDSLNWIVIGTAEAGDGLREALALAAESTVPEPLALIHGWPVRLRCADAAAIAARDDVAAVWFIREEIFPATVNIIRSIDYAMTHGADVLNISLGPHDALAARMVHEPEDPMSLATRRAAEAGCLPVIAVGDPGMINPWCAEWTINVGAATADGSALLERAARGLPGSGIGPTVVAHGVDSIGPISTVAAKGARQLEQEAAAELFLTPVSEDQRHLWTIDNGSSFAAPHVARMAAQIAHFVRKSAEAVIEHHKVDDWGTPSTFAVMYHHPRGYDAQLPRLAGRIEDFGTSRIAVYPSAFSWRTVKQILMDVALPMPGYGPHEVGAGFVDMRLIDTYFTTFGQPEPRIMACKAI